MKKVDKKKKEWNGGAVVSLIYIILYGTFFIILSQLSFIMNSSTVRFQFLLGAMGMIFAFKNFRAKIYGRGGLFYFLSLIPSLIWVWDGFFVSIILSIFVISTLVKVNKR